jgi:hypothetical protein
MGQGWRPRTVVPFRGLSRARGGHFRRAGWLSDPAAGRRVTGNLSTLVGNRPKHPDKQFEALLREAEDRRWRVSRGKGYFKALCPCADKTYISVVLTPSSGRSLINTRKRFERASCWGAGPV